MTLQRFVRAITKCKQIGITQILRSINARYIQSRFDTTWRLRALEKKANHTWNDLVEQLNVQASFADFLAGQKKKYEMFPASKFFLSYDDVYIINQAHQAKNNIFDLLGSGPVHMPKLAWHTDFRLLAQDPSAYCNFPHETYYKDITIASYNGTGLGKDIKLPWELSRFQHLIFLGKAYQITSDESYATTLSNHVMDWINENPFLLGVNWVCPMEVALRAINWIWAFYFFKDAPIAPSIWQKFFCSLYDHFVYVENNWELYDGRTSNHYLSDLVGYVYLCHFFSVFSDSTKKAYACSKRIINEMHRQVFNEGTSYEGSTQYHCLVTELFYHAYIMMKTLNITVPDWYTQRLKNMCEFIALSSPKTGILISIGDNDSGNVLYGGLSENLIQNYKKSYTNSIKHYPEFGLSIATTKEWHITLRHHAYTKKQPSGHFHNDAGSLTLAYNSTPIFVDPGSFVYTASASWRNYFRSVKVHNTFFIKDHESISLDEHIFGLPIPEQVNNEKHYEDTIFVTQHNLYKKFGLLAQRVVEYDSSKIAITDTWLQETLIQAQPLTSVWNFTLAPELKVYNQNNILVIHNNEKELVALTSSDLVFDIEQGWVSPAYGAKEQCNMLRAYAPIVPNKKYTTYINSIS